MLPGWGRRPTDGTVETTAVATAAPPKRSPTPIESTGSAPPRLAPGLELLGEYQGSGCIEPPYLLRRRDGQVLTVSPLLYSLVTCIDGRRGVDEVAARVTIETGRRVSPANAAVLIESRLVPGKVVMAPDEGGRPEASDPVLGVGLRGAIIPRRVVEAASSALSPLFRPAVMTAAVTGLIAFDAWLFFVHGIGRGFGRTAAEPPAVLLTYALLLASAFFHELGHAAAGRYGGARPGRIGVGLHLIWPAFFSDMTDSYRLDRRARLRTDLGGVYFNAVFILGCAGGYWISGFEPILAAIVVQHLLIAYQLLPFLRLDGYYVVSDLIGVPDLFSRIRPVLRGLLPGREPDPAVRELRPGARALVTAWVTLTVPLLVALGAVAAFHIPTLLRTIMGIAAGESRTLGAAVRGGDPASGALAVFRLATVAIVPIGLALIAGRLARGAARLVRSRRSSGDDRGPVRGPAPLAPPAARRGVSTAAALAVVAAALVASVGRAMAPPRGRPRSGRRRFRRFLPRRRDQRGPGHSGARRRPHRAT